MSFPLGIGVSQAAGDPAAGKEKARLCMECHGVDGYSKDERIPHLYGQRAGYIVDEMLEFQEGGRQDPIMSGLARVVTDRQDLEDIAAYFATRPPRQGAAKPGPLAERGKALFAGERCILCHDEDGIPSGPYGERAPILAGQHKAYLVKTLKDIQTGRRGGDEYALMRRTLGRLSDGDIEAIAEYLAGL